MDNLEKFLEEMNYRHDSAENADQVVTNVDVKIAQIASRVVHDPAVLADIELFGSMCDNVECDQILRAEFANVKEKNQELRGLIR